ncbi:hypothetical protein ACFL0V_04265 [Nanoarchaeota archaeon]
MSTRKGSGSGPVSTRDQAVEPFREAFLDVLDTLRLGVDPDSDSFLYSLPDGRQLICEQTDPNNALWQYIVVGQGRKQRLDMDDLRELHARTASSDPFYDFCHQVVTDLSENRLDPYMSILLLEDRLDFDTGRTPVVDIIDTPIADERTFPEGSGFRSRLSLGQVLADKTNMFQIMDFRHVIDSQIIDHLDQLLELEGLIDYLVVPSSQEAYVFSFGGWDFLRQLFSLPAYGNNRTAIGQMVELELELADDSDTLTAMMNGTAPEVWKEKEFEGRVVQAIEAGRPFVHDLYGRLADQLSVFELETEPVLVDRKTDDTIGHESMTRNRVSTKTSQFISTLFPKSGKIAIKSYSPTFVRCLIGHYLETRDYDISFTDDSFKYGDLEICFIGKQSLDLLEEQRHEWFETKEGREFLRSDPGIDYLFSKKGHTYLSTPDGFAYLWSDDGKRLQECYHLVTAIETHINEDLSGLGRYGAPKENGQHIVIRD